MRIRFVRRVTIIAVVFAVVAAGCVLPQTTPGTAGFPNGVAAGDITDDGAILWTRTLSSSTVHLKIFEAVPHATLPLLVAGMNPVFNASTTTSAADDFTTKIPVTGLQSNTTYFYRFTSGTEKSQEGRFVTAPGPTESASFKFVVAADADGFPVGGPPAFNNFEVLNAARLEQPAFFAFLGDTIYSDSANAPGPIITRDEYRDAHEQNRGFKNLRDLMSATGTYAQPDDHEVFNDYDGETVDPARYAAGIGAFNDWMPTDTANVLVDGTCAGSPRYFTQKWGTQVEIFQLDERSCRSDQNPVKAACTDAGVLDLAPTAPSALRIFAGLSEEPPAGCLTALNDPLRTLLGPVQKAAFLADLSASTAQFKIVLSQNAIQQYYALPYDRWEGYGAERAEVLNYIRDNNIDDVVFLTTDVHADIFNDVFIDLTTDPTPIAYEAISGPIATNTFKQEIISAVGAEFVAPFQLVLGIQGVDCQSIDVYSYLVVSVNAAAGTLTLESKDEFGNVVANDLDSSVKCKKVLGP